MGPAKTCPSLKRGLCQAMYDGKCVCYARRAEQFYPQVMPYRQRQYHFWKKCVDRWDILGFVEQMTSTRKLSSIKHLRLNESGDFENQNELEFAMSVASMLFHEYGIVTYGYTARRDLDYTAADFGYFRFRGSGFQKRGLLGSFTFVERGTDIPSHRFVCKGDCRVCSLCLNTNIRDIYVSEHWIVF